MNEMGRKDIFIYVNLCVNILMKLKHMGLGMANWREHDVLML